MNLVLKYTIHKELCIANFYKIFELNIFFNFVTLISVLEKY